VNREELNLKVFERYFGREPGKGSWSEEHDQKQLNHIGKLVDVWEESQPRDSGEALDHARDMNLLTDRYYVYDVYWCYQEVGCDPVQA